MEVRKPQTVADERTRRVGLPLCVCAGGLSGAEEMSVEGEICWRCRGKAKGDPVERSRDRRCQII